MQDQGCPNTAQHRRPGFAVSLHILKFTLLHPQPSSLRLRPSPPLPLPPPPLHLLGAPPPLRPRSHRPPLPPPAVLGSRHPHLSLCPLFHFCARGLSGAGTTCDPRKRGHSACCRFKDFLFRRTCPRGRCTTFV